MRDLRNDFIQDIRLFLSDLDPDVSNQIILQIMTALEKYDLSMRSTEIVPYETGNRNIMKAYAGSMMIDGLALSTIAVYIREIEKLVYFLRNKDLKTVCTFDIREYLVYEKSRGISNRTLENERSNLSAFFQWLTDEEHIPKNPCSAVKSIKYKDEVRKPFNLVELDNLRSNCQNEKERAIIEVLVASGVRVSELVNLNVDDIDFQRKSIHVKHGKGNKERYTYMDSLACSHLIKYLVTKHIESGRLFISSRGPYTTDGIRKLLHVLAKRAGVDNVHPHRFRRTFATTMAARGMDIQTIQKLMGHTNVNTTMIYISMDDMQVINSYRKHTS